MKLLIYVNPKSALANGSSVDGAIDYQVGALLAKEIAALGLHTYAKHFSIPDTATAQLRVHRLDVAVANDVAVLDALSILKHKVQMAQDWARRTVTDPVSRSSVPTYVDELWERYPHTLYRDLLGADVARAMATGAVTPTC